MGFSIINHPFWGTPIFENTYIYISKWWFQTFFLIFTPILEEMIQFDSYFSEWLKPPTRYLLAKNPNQLQRLWARYGICGRLLDMHILINAIYYSLLTRKFRQIPKVFKKVIFPMVLEIGHDPMVSTATCFLGDPRMVDGCLSRLAEKHR